MSDRFCVQCDDLLRRVNGALIAWTVSVQDMAILMKAVDLAEYERVRDRVMELSVVVQTRWSEYQHHTRIHQGARRAKPAELRP